MNDFKQEIEYEYLGLKPGQAILTNPFEGVDMTQPHLFPLHVLRLMRNPDYFYFLCKYLMNGPNGRPLELLPFQCVVLKELWYRPFPMLIANRGFSKSFLLGLFSLLRALLIPGRKIVITGSGFRQAKTVFNYAETIWHHSPILQSLVAEGSNQGPHHDNDRWWLKIGDSTVTALPLGQGDKIRGERAHDTLIDEFWCLEACTLVETKHGMMRIGDYVNNGMTTPVLTGSGDDMEIPNKLIRTPPTEAYKITTMGGYEFTCSGKHRVMTTNGWKLGKDLTQEDAIIFTNTDYFPSEMVTDGELIVDKNVAWLMGILVAEGSIKNRWSFTVNMTDKDCIDRIRQAWNRLDPNINVCHYERDSYKDPRGWTCKHQYVSSVTNLKLRDRFAALGLDRAVAIEKKIPWSILMSPREVIISFLAGLFEGDGSGFLFSERGKNNKFAISYYSVSEQLCREVQILLKKIGIFSTRRSRASKLSDKPQWMIRVNGNYALKLQELLDVPKWRSLYDQAYRIPDDRYKGVVWLKDKNLWRSQVTFLGKVIHLGQFKDKDQAALAIQSMRDYWGDYIRVKKVEKLDGQHTLYDFHIPKAHSFVGNCFHQHNSVPWEIFETVISGFGVVELDPVEKVKQKARVRVMKKKNIWTDEMEADQKKHSISNHTIIAGTAFYQFNHFAEYWKRWKTTVESRGDRKVLDSIFPNGIDDGFDWRDYSVIRIPVDLLPEGFMDEKQLARSKATQHTSTYLTEFSACFASDSLGFFKRSLIEQCVTNTPISPPGSITPVQFKAMTRGNPNAEYIFGIDPASEADRFSIVILEVHPTHRRIVHCWTTTRQEHRQRLQAGVARETDFYGFCGRKIRELMKLFPCQHIAMDSQGGGIAVAEALHDKDKLEPGEVPLWQIAADHPLSDGKVRDTDSYPGAHLIEMVNFARAEWVGEANHGMKKDFEDKVLLFPEYDTGLLAMAMEEDSIKGRLFDTLEDAVAEVEEIKEELSTIVHTQTPTSFRDRWDTPEVKLAGSKKGRLRKDRYSALLMANAAARKLGRQYDVEPPPPLGGFIGNNLYGIPQGNRMYISAPDWFLKGSNGQMGGYGCVVRGVD